MLLLVFSKHALVEFSRQTKQISVMLQMTPTGPHLSKQQTRVQEQALHDSCTKSTSTRPHQTQNTRIM